MIKIGILAAGITPDELIAEYGSYADMVMNLLNTADSTFEYAVFDVRDDIFPNSINQCDAWLITGSKFNVYQNLPWMQQLKELIVDIYAAKLPLIGICFGHQIIAEAMGGKVEAYAGGWGVGLHQYQLQGKHAFFADSKATALNLCAMHQDQVTVKPPIADVFASSDFCVNAGLIYGKQALTFQAHPEFASDYEQALITLRKGEVIPENIAEQGLQTLQVKPNVDNLQVADWIAGFLRV